MEKKTVVYKRRPRKPLSELPANPRDVHHDPRSRLSLVVSDKDGANCINVKESNRKSWIDRSLSTKFLWSPCLKEEVTEKPSPVISRGRRSSVSWGEDFNLSGMAYEWVGTLFKNDDKKHVEGLSNQRIKKPSVVSRYRKVNPPVEFVKEKQALFAEIDAFELESEEESPASKARPQERPKGHVDVSQEISTRRRGLDIVPEDEFEEFADCLSAALLTPHSVLKHDDRWEESSQSSLQSRSSQSSSGSWSSKLRNSLSGSEDYSSPITSLAFDEPSINNYISDANRSSVGSELSVGLEGNRPSRADAKTSSLDYSLLHSGFRNLQIGEGGGQNLIPLFEEDEQEHSKVIDNDGCEGTKLLPQIRKASLKIGAEEPLPVFKALLEECHQARPFSLRQAISDFCDLSEVVKLGEGTFGEAFKGGGCVFKIVPMDGDFLVNAEVQKTSAEIYSEVLLTNTLDRLRGLNVQDSMSCANYCTNFIETKAIRICQGSYEVELCLAWEEWDAVRTSDNDHPMVFPQHQLYVVFVLADGGKDLENFVLSDFNEVRSLLLQVVLALAVAEEGCGFEHRDLHWGNIVLAREQKFTSGYYRLCDEVLKVKTSGLGVSIIDFTLSRIDTGEHVFFYNLSADPALFEGISRDTQADTYRRMLNVTKGNWEGSFPKTNCHWIYYLTDILVKKKSYPCSSQQKRALRSFSKRVLLYESAKAAVSDDFFQDMWIKDFK